MQKIDFNWCYDVVDALVRCDVLTKAEEELVLSFEIDSDSTRYEGGIEKEYALSESVNFSKVYKYIFSASITNYGYKFSRDGDLQMPGHDSLGRFKVEIRNIETHNAIVNLKGSLYGSSCDLAGFNNPIVNCSVIGLKKNKRLGFYWRIVANAAIYHINKDYRMAFFLLFTATERVIIEKFEGDIYNKLYPEFKGPIKHLALVDKLKVLMRSTGTDDLQKIPIWAKLKRVFDELAAKRHGVAHSLRGRYVGLRDVQRCLWLYFVINGMIIYGLTTEKAIKKHFNAA